MSEAVDLYKVVPKTACMDGDSSHEEHKAARGKEIGALRQAEDFLTKGTKTFTWQAMGTRESAASPSGDAGGGRISRHERHHCLILLYQSGI